LDETAYDWQELERLVNVGVGQVANEADGVEMVAGPVGLQSEENVVQFRNVRLTPLASP
jgi:hypothetical protein